MALPDDHQDPEEHAAGPLLPPEDRLWRHPSELGSHPFSSPAQVATAPRSNGGDSHIGALALACLAGVALVAGALWVTWPRESAELAGSSGDTQVDDTPRPDPSPSVTAAQGATESLTASDGARTRLFGLSPAEPQALAAAPARLGVQVIELTVPLVELIGSRAAIEAVEVVEVEIGSAAERFGLQPGDVITAVGPQRIGSASELVEAVTSHEPGDEVTVEVLRRGERHRFRVQLGS